MYCRSWDTLKPYFLIISSEFLLQYFDRRNKRELSCTVKCFHHEVISDCWLIDADWNCRNEGMMKDANLLNNAQCCDLTKLNFIDKQNLSQVLKKNGKVFFFLSSYILRRPKNFAKSPPQICLSLHRTNLRWRFRKFLWPSQNIWTLKPWM